MKHSMSYNADTSGLSVFLFIGGTANLLLGQIERSKNQMNLLQLLNTRLREHFLLIHSVKRIQ